MLGMTEVFIVAGIGVTTHFVNHALEKTGHGDLKTWVTISAYVAGAYVTWELWRELVNYIARMFGVHIRL